jgi:hypothetical protein
MIESGIAGEGGLVLAAVEHFVRLQFQNLVQVGHPLIPLARVEMFVFVRGRGQAWRSRGIVRDRMNSRSLFDCELCCRHDWAGMLESLDLLQGNENLHHQLLPEIVDAACLRAGGAEDGEVDGRFRGGGEERRPAEAVDGRDGGDFYVFCGEVAAGSCVDGFEGWVRDEGGEDMRALPVLDGWNDGWFTSLVLTTRPVAPTSIAVAIMVIEQGRWCKS